MVRSFAILANLAILASSTQASPLDTLTSRDTTTTTTKKACLTNVKGVGSFSQHFKFNFTKLTNFPSSLAISEYGIQASPDDPEHPFDQYYNSTNVIVRKGRPLKMKVPGGQTEGPIQGAEFTTQVADVLYASVRTVAKISTVEGTCHGFFFYKSDTQETDIEIRTSYPDTIFLTNQRVSSKALPTTTEVDAPCDATTDFHEYRYDWVKGATKFYIDGVLVATFKKNVPTKAGSLVWNNWANGGSWSGGPPVMDSVLEIQSIEAYYNRTSVAGVMC